MRSKQSPSPRAAFLLALAIVCLPSCRAKKPRAAPAYKPAVGVTETGTASWYGHPYHGRRAANGEVYDMEKLTAAHRTFLFDTWVRVFNLNNGKRVEVRITDRGPFVDGRIIDLSRAAARAIEMIGPGTAKVRLEVIAPPPNASRRRDAFAVQVGSFQNRGNAERLRQDMFRRYGAARMVLRDADPPLWRVLVGQENSEEKARLLAAQLRKEVRHAFVVRLDEPLPR